MPSDRPRQPGSDARRRAAEVTRARAIGHIHIVGDGNDIARSRIRGKIIVRSATNVVKNVAMDRNFPRILENQGLLDNIDDGVMVELETADRFGAVTLDDQRLAEVKRNVR